MFFGSKCCLCGFNEVQEALEFHHVNPEEKEFGISASQNQTKALDKQLVELKKTILVCSNCHRGIHAGIYKVPDNWQDFYDEKITEELLNRLKDLKTYKVYYCPICGAQVSEKGSCVFLAVRKRSVVQNGQTEKL